MQQFLRIFGASVVFGAVLNAAVAVLTMFVGTELVARLFWSAQGWSVGELASTMGRICGVFNQPIESGLYNSLALLLLVHLWHRRVLASWLASGVAVVILVAGCLAVSKVFVVGGIPLAAAYFILKRGWRTLFERVTVVLAGAGAGALAVLGSWTSGWDGSLLLRGLLIPPEQSSLLYTYSGGRFDNDNPDMLSTFAQLIEISPVIGLGPAGVDLPYDSVWIEMLAIAGICGMGLALLIIVVLWRSAIRQRRQDLLWLFLIILTVGASAGAPSLTVNRYAGVLWILLGAMLIGADRDLRSDSPEVR